MNAGDDGAGEERGLTVQSQIPIRAWVDWDGQGPGFVEVDCIPHDGGLGAGDCCQTLTVTDVHTGWMESCVIRGTRRQQLFAGIVQLCREFPLEVKGISTTAGASSIERYLRDWCARNDLTFSRSDGHRTDGLLVEHRSWSVVRRAVGHHRFDTDEELALLRRLHHLLASQVDYLSPCQKLIDQQRIGARVVKRFDRAATPYQRVLADERVSSSAKDALSRRYSTLNPAEIWRTFRGYHEQLLVLADARQRVTEEPVARRRAS